MADINPKTAILIFVRDPNSEARQKVFAENLDFKANKKLAKVLNQRIIKLCKSTSIPTFVCNSFHQKGASFGARIANAFESIYDQGYKNVIAVGNDCFDISKDLLLNVEQKLNQNEIVLGPARDGGLYLIGLSKSAFKRKEIINFKWTSEYLCQDFRNFADQFEFEFDELQSASDIDNATDFKLAVQALSKLDVFFKTIQEILSLTIKCILLFKNILQEKSYLRYTNLRGPPFLS